MYLAEVSEYTSPLGALLNELSETMTAQIDTLHSFNPSAVKENSLQSVSTTNANMYRALRQADFAAVTNMAATTLGEIRNLYNKHNELKNKIAVDASRGNENKTTSTAPKSSHHSLDKERFDTKKVARPPDIYHELAVAVEGSDNLLHQLSASVSREAKQSSSALQNFVSAVFKEAKETHDKDRADNTIRAILDWEEDAAVNVVRGKPFGPSTNGQHLRDKSLPTHFACSYMSNHSHNRCRATLHSLVDMISASSDYGVTAEQSMDVRPGNIMVKYSEGDTAPKGMRGDWGCVTSKEKLKKFRGCTPYAHDSLHGQIDAST